MRIIAGAFRGRRLTAPQGKDTRPTTDRDREALFSALSHALDHDFTGLRVLDLFAGTGVLGLEALSRGAAHATFVDNNARALAVIHDNIETLNVAEQTQCLRSNALRLPKTLSAFDLAFADAPYGKSQSLKALIAAFDGGYVTTDTTCVIECSEMESEALDTKAIQRHWQRRRGDSVLTLLQILHTLKV